MSILKQILTTKLEEISLLPPMLDLRSEVRDLDTARSRKVSSPFFISEIKFRSPSKGIIREGITVEEVASGYEEAGASVISVLTDVNYFGGHLRNLSLARSATANVPLLRKDFIIDRRQVYEARIGGADYILLIAAAMTSKSMLEDLIAVCIECGLSVLLEIHDEAESVLATDAVRSWTYSQCEILVGINNRSLDTFIVDLAVTEKLAPKQLKDTDRRTSVVSESGIYTGDEVRRLMESGATGFLVGEPLMREGSPKINLAKLIDDSKSEKLQYER